MFNRNQFCFPYSDRLGNLFWLLQVESSVLCMIHNTPCCAYTCFLPHCFFFYFFKTSEFRQRVQQKSQHRNHKSIIFSVVKVKPSLNSFSLFLNKLLKYCFSFFLKYFFTYSSPLRTFQYFFAFDQKLFVFFL